MLGLALLTVGLPSSVALVAMLGVPAACLGFISPGRPACPVPKRPELRSARWWLAGDDMTITPAG